MSLRFADFEFEPDQRRLTKAGEPVELSSRYLDALALMLAEAGSLVTKDQFMDQVWRGVPVTDEALTQAIRALRKALGDDAANPKFIETVPKHGYRFIAPVSDGAAVTWDRHSQFLQVGIAGAAGGAVAGVIGGVGYAIIGGGSGLLVLVALTGLLGALGGAGIGLGIGVARTLATRSLIIDIVGGAAGGLVVGALARLLGIDAFRMLLGDAPFDMTGASEGLVLGAAIGLVVGRLPSRRRATLGAGILLGALAGISIAALGGRLMAGSLALLFETFPQAGVEFRLPFTFPGGLWLALAIPAIEAAIFVALVSVALTSVEKPTRQP